MPRQGEKYRFRDGVTPLNEDTFNRILQDIDLRISNLEGVNADWEAATDTIRDQGLARVDTSLTPLLVALTAQINDLAAYVEASQQLGAILDAPDSVSDLNIGARTVDPETEPTGNTGDLTTLLSALANRIEAITGSAWSGAPPATLPAILASLATVAAHMASHSNPHEVSAAQVAALSLAGGTLAGSVGFGGNNASNIKMVGLAAEYDNGTSGSAKTITLANGNLQKISIDQTCTLTIDSTGALPGVYRLRLITTTASYVTATWSGLSGSNWLGSASAPGIRYGAVGYVSLLEMFLDGANIVQRLTKVGAT